VFAAATVRCSVERACTHLGWSLPGRSVAIEGFGSVGQALAGMLSQSGAVIVAVSTAQGAVFNQDGLDIPTLTALTRTHGSRAVELFEGGARIECQQLLELPVDILCPCARHDSITDHNQDRIRARLVCAGANNPTTPAARMQLEARGILVMPDFVTSCGGVLGGALEYASVPRPAILRFIDRHVGPRVSWLLDRSSVLGESAFQIATQVSLERFAAVKARAEKPSLRGLLFNQLLALYRRGVIPGPVTSVLARRYAAANLAERRFG